MNREKLKSSGVARLYLWTTKAKYTMGIFFVAYVFAYLLFGLLMEEIKITLDFFTALQMIFASFFIGVLQQIILPAEKLSRLRCVVWVAAGVIITLLFSLIFGWFSPFPTWSFILFLLVVAFGMAAMIAGYYLEMYHETKRLNRSLAQYQQRGPQKEA